MGREGEGIAAWAAGKYILIIPSAAVADVETGIHSAKTS
jgi:hypothetical protein